MKDPMAIARINEFHAKPGHGAELRAFLMSVVTDVRTATGCRTSELYEALDVPGHCAVIEVWDCVEDHKAAGRHYATPARIAEAMALFGAPAAGTCYRSV